MGSNRLSILNWSNWALKSLVSLLLLFSAPLFADTMGDILALQSQMDQKALEIHDIQNKMAENSRQRDGLLRYTGVSVTNGFFSLASTAKLLREEYSGRLWPAFQELQRQERYALAELRNLKTQRQKKLQDLWRENVDWRVVSSFEPLDHKLHALAEKVIPLLELLHLASDHEYQSLSNDIARVVFTAAAATAHHQKVAYDGSIPRTVGKKIFNALAFIGSLTTGFGQVPLSSFSESEVVADMGGDLLRRYFIEPIRTALLKEVGFGWDVHSSLAFSNGVSALFWEPDYRRAKYPQWEIRLDLSEMSCRNLVGMARPVTSEMASSPRPSMKVVSPVP